MSFVKKIPAQAVNSQFKLELVPNPASKLADEQKVAQTDMIQRVHRVSNGLFLPNPAVSVNGSIKSSQVYNRSVKVSHLVDAMRQHDLVLRVSVSGDHTACAMATPDNLEKNEIISSLSGSFSLGIRNNYIRDVDFV